MASDVLTCNPVMDRLYELRTEDFEGTREAWDRAEHPDDSAFVVQELQAVLRGWHEYQPRFRVIWPMARFTPSRPAVASASGPMPRRCG